MKGPQLFILLLLCCVFLIGSTACKKQTDTLANQNHPIQLSDYRGKWLVLNYWATWCTPCLTELPELNKLYTQHSDKLNVLAVNFDGLTAEKTADFTQNLALEFPLLSSFPKEKLGISDISALPVTFLISPQGKLVKTLHGPQTEQSLLQEIGG